MTRPLLLLILLVGCPSTRNLDDDDATDDDAAPAVLNVTVDVADASVPELSGIYVDEVLPEGSFWQAVVAGPDLTCAAYQQYWAQVNDLYDQVEIDGDWDAYHHGEDTLFQGLVGMPDWWLSMRVFVTPPSEDPTELATQTAIDVLEYQAGPPEMPSFGPMQVGAALTGWYSPEGTMDTTSGAVGTISAEGPWFDDLSQEAWGGPEDRRAVTISFDVPWCDLEER